MIFIITKVNNINVGLDPFDNVNSNASLHATMQMGLLSTVTIISPLHFKFSFALISLAPHTPKLLTRNSVTAIPSSHFNFSIICVNMKAII